MQISTAMNIQHTHGGNAAYLPIIYYARHRWIEVFVLLFY